MVNDPDIANYCYNIITTKFIKPIINKPFRVMYVDTKHPFNEPLTKQQLGKFDKYNYSFLYVPIDNYGNKFKSNPLYDSSYVNVPWIKVFVGKRRAARWLQTPAEMIRWYFSQFGIEDQYIYKLLNYPISYVFSLFKKMKVWIHNNFDNYGATLRIFCDLETICGIFPMNYRMSQDDPYLWLTKLVRSEYDRHWWSNQFMQTFIDAAIRMPDAVPSIEEYVLSPWMWVTPGASKFSRLYLEDEYIRTKFGLAVSTTDEEKMKWLQDARFGINGQEIDIFIKSDETGPKTRYIANCQIGIYWIAGYILKLIRLYCGFEPLFSKLSPTTQDKFDVITLLQEHHQMLPLDESSYDYHVTRDSWLGFIDFLELAFPNNTGVQYFKEMFNNTKWVFGVEEGKWLKGMPSGLALTSILNSWMNYIKQKTIVPGYLQWAAGDDALVAPYKETDLQTVELEYLKFGSETNATKNWISYRYGEYLKSLYGEHGSTGYPARIFGTLLYAQDMSYTAPASRLNELASLWKLFYDRAGIHMNEDVVATDLNNALSMKIKGFTKTKAKLWLHSPKIFGGFGKLPYNNYTFTWHQPITKVKYYKNSRYRLPPVIEHWGPVQMIVGTQKISDEVSVYLGKPLTLPPITNEDEWVKALNRENIPDRGPFTDMQLELVPLPVIDFVSFVNMSNFARDGGYNCEPNLHGSWQTISSRLIMLSLKLVKYVEHQLSLHDIQVFV